MKALPSPRRLSRKAPAQPSTLPNISAIAGGEDLVGLKGLSVTGDWMAPTLEAGDIALVEPVRSYRGAGVDVLRIAYHDGFEVFRVERDGDRRLRLLWDNARAGGIVETMSVATFSGLVVGKVTGKVQPVTPADIPTLRRRGSGDDCRAPGVRGHHASMLRLPPATSVCVSSS